MLFRSRPAGIGALPPAYHYLAFGPHHPALSFVDCVIPNSALVNARKGPRVLNAKNYDGAISYSYHLDAGLFANFMRDAAVLRGIRHIRDDVLDVTLGENGAVSALQLKEAGHYPVEFVVDCTGYKSLIIDRLRTEPFVSFSDSILNDKAKIGRAHV